MHAEVETLKGEFESAYQPATPEARRLVQTAVLAFVRSLHLARAQHELGIDRVRHAFPLYDAQRQDRVHSLVNMLSVDPLHALSHLYRLTEGCDYLADAFAALAAELQQTGTLTADSQLHARQLHGLTESSRAHTAELVVLLENLAQLPAPESADPANLNPAAQAILAHLEAQSEANLEAADRIWNERDEASRNQAPDVAYFDPSPEASRLHRYLMRAHRTYEQAIKALQAQKSATPPQHQPTQPPPTHHAPPPTRHSAQNEPTVPQPLSHIDFEDMFKPSDRGCTYLDFSITPRPTPKPAKRRRLG
jgi:hypothetical protein